MEKRETTTGRSSWNAHSNCVKTDLSSNTVSYPKTEPGPASADAVMTCARTSL